MQAITLHELLDRFRFNQSIVIGSTNGIIIIIVVSHSHIDHPYIVCTQLCYAVLHSQRMNSLM